MSEHSIYCPHCHKYTALLQRGSFGSIHGAYWIGECQSCHQCVLVHEPTGRIVPNPLPGKVAEELPPSIRSDFSEALLCESVGALRAAGVMARRAMQGCCIGQGAPHDPSKFNSIIEQIDWLVEQQIIPKQLSQWAHEIRLVGKDCAHPNKPEDEIEITAPEIREILELLEHLTDVLYVAPAKAEKRKQEREGRQKISS